MSSSPYSQSYIDHYTNIAEVFPSVFALKMFLGRNPELYFKRSDFKGKSILDVGFGDGRDLVLFHKLGFKVFGIEVDEKVVEHTKDKFSKFGMNPELSVGYNDETGFRSNKFDFVFSCAALMYLRNLDSNVQKTLNHIYGIIKPGGRLLGTFTRFDSHITLGSKKIDNNRILCADRFYKQRKGQIYWIHKSKDEVKQDLLSSGFDDCKVYDYDVDWFGTRETAFIFSARKQRSD